MEFIMTDEALENYGEQYRGVRLIPTHIATMYMPAKQFFAQGKPKGYHPGYDEGMKGSPLYDLKRKDTGEELNFSLYGWELRRL
jgi:hypothetical protein